MVSPHRIKYAGISSDDLSILDLIMCASIDGDNGETNSFLNRSAVQSESHDGRYKPTTRYKYDEVFAPKFTFMKKDFSDFSMDEVRVLLKYLTIQDTTALLEVFYDDTTIASWVAIGGWTAINLQKLANNRTIGVTAVFSAVHPFALSDIYTTTQTISSTEGKITIDIDTDDNKPVCPRIVIIEKDLVINIPQGLVYNALSDMVENTVYFNGNTYYWKTENSTDPIYFHSSTTKPDLSTTSVRFRTIHTDFLGQQTMLPPVVIKNNNATEIITIDGANKIISSNSVNRIFGDDFVGWRWLELYDGKNEITIEGNCDVKLEWREVRKIGEY